MPLAPPGARGPASRPAVMRLCVLLGMLALAWPQAAWSQPTPQIRDERDDTIHPSLDILSATFSRLDRVSVALRLQLAAGPARLLPAVYEVSVTYPGCRELAIEVRWDGNQATTGRLNGSRCSAGGTLATLDAVAVPVRVTGNVIEWRVPHRGFGYAPGTWWVAPIARSAPALAVPAGGVGVWVALPGGDSSSRGRPYRVGT